MIKKYDNIVISRHIGADPDALGSSVGLKEILKYNFPNKNIYVVGNSSARFKYFGLMDKNIENTSSTLLIVTDTPDKKRVDGVLPDSFDYKIKIDHHPFVEKFCDIEWIDDTASSASQMIIELAFKCNLKIPSEAAEKLYMGIVGDTGRFMYNYTSVKTFELVYKLIKKTNIDFVSLYEPMYLRNLNDIKFNAYLTTNMTVTENKLAYIKLDDKTLKEHNVDASTAGNLINNFDNIDEILVTIFCSEDVLNNYIKCSIRSRGPIINDIAAKFNGGGHALASGAKLKSFEECDELIKSLEEACEKYINEV
jgi:phosphoesterase RecJ-like protein